MKIEPRKVGDIVFFSEIVRINWISIEFVLKIYKRNKDNILMQYSLAFLIAMFGLLVAYVPSSALWIPYSWVFFALPTGLALSALKNKIVTRKSL